VIACVLLSYLSLNAQETITWDYPIKPGMKEWATLKTGKQKVEVCQIPLDVLKTIGTKELAAVIINKQNKKEEQDVINMFIQNYNHLDPNTLTEMSKLIRR